MIITYADEVTRDAILKTIEEIKGFFPIIPDIKIMRSDSLTVTIEERDKGIDFNTIDKIKTLIELNMTF